MYNVSKYHEVTNQVLEIKNVSWEFVCSAILKLESAIAQQGAFDTMRYHGGRLLVTQGNRGGNIVITEADENAKQ